MSAIFEEGQMEAIRTSTTSHGVSQTQAPQLSESHQPRITDVSSNQMSGEQTSNTKMLQDSIEGVRKGFNQLNDLLKVSQTHLRFEVDDSTHQVVIKIQDEQSGKLIRQIPSEEALKISKNLTQYLERIQQAKSYLSQQNSASTAKGLIMDSQA